jgi:mono/diheme cytochrome c family protein
MNRAGLLACVLLVGCPREAPTEETTVAPQPKPVDRTRKRPEPPGDPRHGWTLFAEHCVACHGASRRGRPGREGEQPAQPADLRDPILLASRTNDQLATAILHGVTRKGPDPGNMGRHDMPAFQSELGEQDVMDVIAFLRGDSIYLEECFPVATHYLALEVDKDGPPLFAAYDIARPDKPARPVVIRSKGQLPEGSVLAGYVMFTEIDLPGIGATPSAFLARPDGRVFSARVALPEPDNVRAESDIDSVIDRGEATTAKTRTMRPSILAMKARLERAIMDHAKPSH